MTEHQEQCALIKMARLHENKYPELKLLHAIPNGGHRHIGVARKMKAEGQLAGIPDLFLPAPRGDLHGLYIELKAKGGRVSEAQREILTALANAGYAALVAYGWENAWKEIVDYLESGEVKLCKELF